MKKLLLSLSLLFLCLAGAPAWAQTTESWMHGNAFTAEWVGGCTITAPGTAGSCTDLVDGHPWTDIVGSPRGFGKTFRLKEGNSDWFHVSIPTPVLRGGVHATLSDVMVLYDQPG